MWEGNRERERRRVSFQRTPFKFVYEHCGGQVMTFILMGLTMSFAIALVKPDALLGFAGCLTGLGGCLAYRAVGNDAHVTKAKILGAAANGNGGNGQNGH